MAIMKWQPKASLLQQLQHDLFDVLSDVRDFRGVGQWIPSVDIQEKDKSFIVTMEVPGVSTQDIQINMEGNKLTVQGEKKHEYEENLEGVYRVERSYGGFYREFTLPKTVKGDQIQASCKNGVLKMEIPKAEQAVSRQIPIEEM